MEECDNFKARKYHKRPENQQPISVLTAISAILEWFILNGLLAKIDELDDLPKIWVQQKLINHSSDATITRNHSPRVEQKDTTAYYNVYGQRSKGVFLHGGAAVFGSRTHFILSVQYTTLILLTKDNVC